KGFSTNQLFNSNRFIMSFAFIILIRVLFIACMVFIIGYVFGSFSARPVLKTLSRVAAIVLIVLFIAMNGLYMRASFAKHGGHGPCWMEQGQDGVQREDQGPER